MSKMCRHTIFAIVGWLSLGAANFNAPTKPEKLQPIGNAIFVNANVKSSVYEASERMHRAKYEPACDPAIEKRDSDLCAQWKAADATADSASSTWWGIWISGLSGLLVLAALYLTFRSNQIARDTAKRQLRAYVSHVEYVMKHHHDSRGNLVNHDITAIWLNGGQTPAFDAQCVINFVLCTDPLPDDFTFPPPENAPEFGTLALGPGQKCNCLSPSISHQQLLNVGRSALRLFVWSQAEYVDAFDVRRRSEVACEVRVVVSEDSLRIVFNSLSKHNGMDASCMHPPGEK